MGDSWHELATEAPQCHENHVLNGTLGFNLLMGRNWPASQDELQEATDLCKELGLAELLERMPSGTYPDPAGDRASLDAASARIRARSW